MLAVHVVVCEGRERHGYEVRRAGGGIGAGFPSVSLCSIEFPARVSPAKGIMICSQKCQC